MKQITLHVYQSIDGCPGQIGQVFRCGGGRLRLRADRRGNLPAHLPEPSGLAAHGKRDFGRDGRLY